MACGLVHHNSSLLKYIFMVSRVLILSAVPTYIGLVTIVWARLFIAEGQQCEHYLKITLIRIIISFWLAFVILE